MIRKVLGFMLMIEKKNILELQEKMLTTSSKYKSEHLDKKDKNKKDKNKKKNKIKKRVDFAKCKRKAAKRIMSKQTNKQFNSPDKNKKLCPLELEEEKMGNKWDSEFEMFSDIKGSEDRFDLNKIIENADNLFRNSFEPVDNSSPDITTFKVKQSTSKAIKRRKNNEFKEILEVVSEQKESEDGTKRRMFNEIRDIRNIKF